MSAPAKPGNPSAQPESAKRTGRHGPNRGARKTPGHAAGAGTSEGLRAPRTTPRHIGGNRKPPCYTGCPVPCGRIRRTPENTATTQTSRSAPDRARAQGWRRGFRVAPQNTASHEKNRDHLFMNSKRSHGMQKHFPQQIPEGDSDGRESHSSLPHQRWRR